MSVVEIEEVGTELLERHFPRPVPAVLDVGCGIRPQRLVETRLHVCVDVHRPYLEHLQQEAFDGVLIAGSWRTVLPRMLDKSFDAVFALDAIEHFSRDDGRDFIAEAQRLADTVLIFTPNGPFPQSYGPGESDAWGMRGGRWQTHHSAWTPADFDGWAIYELPGFHETDADGRPLDEPIGAFWAVWG